MLLVTDFLYSSKTAAIATAGIGLILLVFWYVLPITRRLRTTPAIRRLTAENRLAPAELILPAFIREGLSEPNPIASMPGVVQHTLDTLRKAAVEAGARPAGGS